jgi:hypothetical protein
VAIYSNPALYNPYAYECGITIKAISGPPILGNTWIGIWVYFWAMQFGFRRPDNSSSGGGHLGLIWANDDVSTGVRSVINCGIYDDIYGPIVAPDLSTVRGSIPDSRYFVGGADSYVWLRPDGSPGWNYGDVISFRVFLSPKQNWTAAELHGGANQPVEYLGVNQKTSGTYGAETAYRCVVKRNNEPWMFFRDVLMKDTIQAPSPAIQGPSIFTEPIYDTDPANTPHFGLGEWPYSPCAEWRDFIWDGRRAAPGTWNATYAADRPNSDVRLVTDGGVQWVQHITDGVTPLTRTNADSTILTPTFSSFFTASPSNVSPSITDNAARVTTTRPWY